MDKKNRELAKRNTELLEEISRLTDIHSDILKESIKQKYYRTRNFNKLVDQVEKQVDSIKEVLEGSLYLKESLLRIMDIKEKELVVEGESETSVFQQTMKILDTICDHEDKEDQEDKEGDSKKGIASEKTPVLKEVNLNKNPKRKRKSVTRK